MSEPVRRPAFSLGPEQGKPLSGSGHFSVTTAVVLVLGGLAAFALATAIALRSSERVTRAQATTVPAPAASSASPPSSAAPSAWPSTSSPESEIDLE